MPYYFGEDMPGWDGFIADEDGGETVIPPNVFKYVEPWAKETTVMAFPNVPGPELEKPEYDRTNWNDFFSKDQAYRSTNALNGIAALSAKCREANVVQVIGSYQGGNDEGFTHFHGIILRDGRRIMRPVRLHEICDVQTIKTAELADGRHIEFSGKYFYGADELLVRAVTLRDGRRIERPSDLPVGIDFDELVENAVTALMGSWGAGAYELYGAVTINIDARTITDEKDRDTVFAAKVT
jgi:hypothetical protein